MQLICYKTNYPHGCRGSHSRHCILRCTRSCHPCYSYSLIIVIIISTTAIIKAMRQKYFLTFFSKISCFLLWLTDSMDTLFREKPSFLQWCGFCPGCKQHVPQNQIITERTLSLDKHCMNSSAYWWPVNSPKHLLLPVFDLFVQLGSPIVFPVQA